MEPQNENNKVIEIEALDVLVYLENIYPLFILIKPTIYARELCDRRNLIETHSDTDWELPIGWYSILFYHKEIEFYEQTLIIPFDILQYV